MLPDIGPQVLAHKLTNQTQMALLKKVVIQPHDKLRLFDLRQDLILFFTTLLHHLIFPYHLYREHLSLILCKATFDHGSEHALAQFLEHSVLAIVD